VSLKVKTEAEEIMRILVLSPFGATEPYGEENLKKVARPGTEFSFESINF